MCLFPVCVPYYTNWPHVSWGKTCGQIRLQNVLHHSVCLSVEIPRAHQYIQTSRKSYNRKINLNVFIPEVPKLTLDETSFEKHWVYVLPYKSVFFSPVWEKALFFLTVRGTLKNNNNKNDNEEEFSFGAMGWRYGIIALAAWVAMVAWVPSLAREFPHVTGADQKKKKWRWRKK